MRINVGILNVCFFKSLHNLFRFHFRWTLYAAFGAEQSRSADIFSCMSLLLNCTNTFRAAHNWTFMKATRQCDNYNLKSHRRCNNMSRSNFSGYIGHVTIFSWMFTITCCSSPFLPRSVSSFTHWSAGTFNCPLCGRIWRFKCRQVRQIKPAQLAFGRTIK